MHKLRALRLNVLDASDEKALKMIQQWRYSRQVPKVSPQEKKQAVKRAKDKANRPAKPKKVTGRSPVKRTRKVSPAKAKAAMAKMSPEDIAALKAQF